MRDVVGDVRVHPELNAEGQTNHAVEDVRVHLVGGGALCCKIGAVGCVTGGMKTSAVSGALWWRVLVCATLVGWGASAAMAAEEELLNRIAALRSEIAHHDDLYFRQAAPEITDYEYDLLKLELRRLEEEAGVSSSASVGDDLSGDAVRVVHGQPMLSLDKAYSEDEVAAFFDRVAAVSPGKSAQYAIEPKFDGVAVNVVLRRGALVSASTRGDGSAGEDVTVQIRAVRGLDYEWAFDLQRPRIEEIELRGEVFLSHAVFARLNEERETAGLEPFRHPRSVAAGSIKLDDVTEVAARGLSIVFHGWGAVKPVEAAPPSVKAFQQWLRDVGLPAVEDASFVTPRTAAELNAAIAVVRSRDWPYPTDGVVLKVDDAARQTALGNGPTAPRWALARKFSPPRAETRLRQVVWQVGRTGALTPVAEFDPVVIGGATITRASLHNAAEFVRRELHRDDTIWIEKAGQIIPQVAGVVVEQRAAGAEPLALPQRCPSCGEPLRIDKPVTQVACPNWTCAAQLEQRVLHYASRQALGIRGLGPGMVKKLVEAGLVQAIPDLYGLTIEQLVELPGVGMRTAEQLVAAIAESRDAPLARVLVGLGLPGLGPSGARELAAKIARLSDLLEDPDLEETLKEPGRRDVVRRLAAILDSR